MAVAMEAARQLDPLRGGIVHLEELPMADSRSRASSAALATRPALRRQIAADPGIIPCVIEELPRVEGPDTIDFERKQKYSAFGDGPHACLGSHLARFELRVVLEEWHRRIPDYTRGPGGSDQVDWPAGLIGIDSLPLVFPPGGGPA